jgi:nucleoside phosphorylase
MDVSGVDVVILTALPEEHDAVVRALGQGKDRSWRGYSLHEANVGGTNVIALPIGGMGNAGSAHAATLAIGIWNPAAILLVGITGGIRASDPDLQLGDVLVPEQIVGYEQGKHRETGLERRFQVQLPSWNLVQTARGLRPDDWAAQITESRPDGTTGSVVPAVFFGPIMSGEKVVAAEDVTADLRRSWPKAVGIEMEGVGAALAAYRGGPEFLMVKAVSDYADTTKEDNWHPYAAEAAARFAVSVLQRCDYRGLRRRSQAQPAAPRRPFSGRQKLEFVRTLHDSWEDLADAYDLSAYERGRLQGVKARALWEWLEVRGKLGTLPAMLDEIDRGDIADRLRDS